MTVTTDKLLLEKHRLEREIKEVDEQMERATGYKRRQIYRSQKLELNTKLIKVNAKIIANTAKK